MNRKTTVLVHVTIMLLFVSNHINARPISRNLAFIENKGQVTNQFGQARTDINAKVSSEAVTVYIGSGLLHYQWSVPLTKNNLNNKSLDGYRKDSFKTYRMDVRLLGANKNARLIKTDKQSYYENYYLPHLNGEGIQVSSFRKIIYKNIYPLIDWVIYIKRDKMEYDFVVHPGGKVSDICMQYTGATQLKINEDGSLAVTTPLGQIEEAAPISFQDDGIAIASSFLIDHNIVKFSTADFKGRLTIDPMVSWASYFGGSVIDEIRDIATNKNNELYGVGLTMSFSNIATTGAHQTTIAGSDDGFIFKLDTLQNIEWATYYGSDESESIYSLDVDSSGYIYVAGATTSPQGSIFTTTGCHQPNLGGDSDIFFAKFSSKGVRIFGSYYGGNNTEHNPRIAIQGGYFYLSGYTKSEEGIASNGSHQSKYGGGREDAFLAQFDLNGKRQWSTYYGGEGMDGFANSIAADIFGNIYLFGNTNSNNAIATAGSYMEKRLKNTNDHFLVKFNHKGIRQWGTYFGGSKDATLDWCTRNLDCDQLGNIYMAGITNSDSAIATTGAHQSILAGTIDAYLVKWDSNGTRQWATYFGGEGEEKFVSVHCIDNDNIYISGGTPSSKQIAKPSATQQLYGGGYFYGDAYLAKFNANGHCTFATYHGGTGEDLSMSITHDNNGYIYIGGITNSTGSIATSGSFQDVYPNGILWNAFLAKYCFAPAPTLLTIEGPDTVCAKTGGTYTVSTSDADAYLWSIPEYWIATEEGNSLSVSNIKESGKLGVRVVRCDDTSALTFIDVYMLPANTPEITIDGFQLGTSRPFKRYQWYLEDQPIKDAINPYYTVTENGSYTVITEDNNGCIDTSASYPVNNVDIINKDRRQNPVKIYPNPTNDIVFIDTKSISTYCRLYSLDGKLLLQHKNANSISLNDYAPGVYLLEIKSENGIWLHTEKIIKVQ